MKIKANELSGPALDWAVEKCHWIKGTAKSMFEAKPYSTDWAHAGPIIKREAICLNVMDGLWTADTWRVADGEQVQATDIDPLVAAMRCYVLSRLSDEVEVPDALLA